MNSGGNRNGKPLALKTRNNVLGILSNALKYAAEVELIDEAPRIRAYKSERPEIECWDLDEWRRFVTTARSEGPGMFAAALLAGDAGLRLGEVLALRWESIDLVAGRVAVTRQLRKGVEGTPKSGRRRSVPMTAALATPSRGSPRCASDGSSASRTASPWRRPRSSTACIACVVGRGFRSGAGTRSGTPSPRTRRASG